MTPSPQVRTIPVRGGRVEVLELPGGPGHPLLVVGGVEMGLRPLAGTESVHIRRWQGRRQARPVTVIGRPLPDDPADTPLLLHPRASGAALAEALRTLPHPVAIEAESGGGRISLWLTVDHPDLVSRLVLVSAAAETQPRSPMDQRLRAWAELAEVGQWDALFESIARHLKPAALAVAQVPGGTGRLHPRPSTPERFIAELLGTPDPTAYVTARLAEITVPTLVLAGGQDQVVPPSVSEQLASGIRGARFVVDPDCGHAVRAESRGYDDLVEAFLAEGN